MSKENELPQGWIKAPISAVALINPGVDTTAIADDTLVSFVPMTAVEEGTGRMNTSTLRRLGDVRRGYTAFQENDIIFAKITPSMENGKFAVARFLSAGIGFGSTEFHILRPEEGVEPQLLYYYLSQTSFRQAARNLMTGSAGQLRVPATFLADTTFPLAPNDEQRRIVDAIEEQFSRLNAVVTSLQQDLIKLKLVRETILKSAVKGELTSKWRAQAEYSAAESGAELLERILNERRTKWEAEQLARMQTSGMFVWDDEWKRNYKEPSLPDTKNLPELPKGWCWATVEQLVGQPTNGLQIRIAAPEPARRRRRARSRRRRRLPFHTKGVGSAFQPATVCSNHSMTC